MAITGYKEVDLHRDELAPPGFTLQIVWFLPSRESGPRHSVETLDTLRQLLLPYRDYERLVIYLNRDDGDSGLVWVHITGDRAWVTYMTMPGGEDTYCRNIEKSPDEKIGFWLSNGQEDLIHWSWTVPRFDGMRALEYFLQYGERDPSLCWGDPRFSFLNAEQTCE
jgi:hypothetical protein